jgi:hypothetical protein
MLIEHRSDSGDKPADDTNIDEYVSKRVYDLYDLVHTSKIYEPSERNDLARPCQRDLES